MADASIDKLQHSLLALADVKHHVHGLVLDVDHSKVVRKHLEAVDSDLQKSVVIFLAGIQVAVWLEVFADKESLTGS